MASSSFISKTIKGGIFFLVPIALIIILFGKLLDILKPLALFISKRLDPADKSTFDLSYLISIVILILLCFLFGLIANTGLSKMFVRWIEKNILAILPGYQMMKNTIQSAAGLDATKNFPVVLVLLDGWMIAFLMESLPDDEVVVYVPGSPSPWSGSVIIINRSEIRETSLTQREALQILRHTGIGLKDLKKK